MAGEVPVAEEDVEEREAVANLEMRQREPCTEHR